MASTAAAKLSVLPRRWFERGHADHGWLKTFHTFSFATHYDDAHMSFGNLRVINEDRVAGGTGFGEHGHSQAEIFSIVLDGQLEHKDSMGNTEVLSRGDIQFTSAGTGIRHSERNAAPRGKKDVHFLQIWFYPDVRNLPPRYYTTHTSEESKRNTLKTLVKPISTFSKEDADKHGLLAPGRAIPSNSTLVTRTSVLSSSQSVQHVLGTDSQTDKGSERWLYIHLAQTSGYKDPSSHQKGAPMSDEEAKIQFEDGNGTSYTLNEGDGAYIRGGRAGESITITNPSSKDAEFVLFDLRPE